MPPSTAKNPQAANRRCGAGAPTALAGLVLLPVGATALYLALGSPQLPGQPLAARLQAVHQDRSIQSLVAQVEAHLERNPNDARGYEVVAPVYLRLGRFDDAVNARRKLLALAGETAERQADLGEALAAAGNGIVTVEAKAAFERALALDPNDLKAQVFIGVAAEQDGDRHEGGGDLDRHVEGCAGGRALGADGARSADARRRHAAVLLRASAARSPACRRCRSERGRCRRRRSMSEQDRGDMIRGMVARLADKLKEDGSDLDGWQRLLRAYMVLGERDKAQAAAGDAKKALASDPDKLRQIGDTIKSMGLEG